MIHVQRAILEKEGEEKKERKIDERQNVYHIYIYICICWSTATKVFRRRYTDSKTSFHYTKKKKKEPEVSKRKVVATLWPFS